MLWFAILRPARDKVTTVFRWAELPKVLMFVNNWM